MRCPYDGRYAGWRIGEWEDNSTHAVYVEMVWLGGMGREREREGEKRMSLVVEVDVLYCTVLTTAVTWNNVLHGQHDVRRRWG